MPDATSQSITVGPVSFATITGDVFAAISERLAAAGATWSGLALHLKMSRQNLQRAVRLQRALRFEVLLPVLNGLRHFEKKPEIRPYQIRQQMEAMGLKLEVNSDTETAMLEAVSSMVTRAREGT